MAGFKREATKLPRPPHRSQDARTKPKVNSFPWKWTENSLMRKIWKPVARNPRRIAGM
jgi:hypothetical protein